MLHLAFSFFIAALFSVTQAQWSSFKSQRTLPPPPPPPIAAQASSFTTKFYEFEQPAALYPQGPGAYHVPSPMYSPPSNTIEDYSSLIKLVKTLGKTSEKESGCNTGDIINKLIDALIMAVTGKNQSSRNSDTEE